MHKCKICHEKATNILRKEYYCDLHFQLLIEKINLGEDNDDRREN